jgi:hypothetical protein
MMIFSVAVFNVLHPGWLLPSGRTISSKTERSSTEGLEMNRSDDGLEGNRPAPLHW